MTIKIDVAPNNERELVLARIVDATPEQLFKLWTTPERFPEWFCPQPWRAEVTKMDLRPGGASENVMYGPDGGVFPNHGVYLEIVPNKKIVFTDAFTEGWIPQTALRSQRSPRFISSPASFTEAWIPKLPCGPSGPRVSSPQCTPARLSRALRSRTEF